MIANDLPSILAISPDESFLDALKRGEAGAYEQLVREMGGRVLAVAKRLLNDANEAEEVVADTFATVYRKIGQFEGGARLSTWIHRITVNTALLRMRSRRSRREVFAEDLKSASGDPSSAFELMAGSSDTADGLTLDSELKTLLHRAIEKLPQKHRIVLELRDIQQRSPEETAATLGITRNAVKIRLHRARRALKGVLESKLGSRLEDILATRERGASRTPWSTARRPAVLRATA